MCRHRRTRWYTCIRRPRSSARSTSPRTRFARPRAAFSTHSQPMTRHPRCRGRPTPRPHTLTSTRGARRAPCPAPSTCGPSCAGSTSTCPTMRSWPAAQATSRRGCTARIAIAAKLVHPDRVVVSWNGDGCFQMNGQELATAMQYRLPIVFVIVDNGMYGTIRMHQERTFPARVSGTTIVNPDFAACARAYGAYAATVTSTAEFAPAFPRALAAGTASLLHLKVDPQALTMGASLDALRAQGEAAQRKQRE